MNSAKLNPAENKTTEPCLSTDGKPTSSTRYPSNPACLAINSKLPAHAYPDNSLLSYTHPNSPPSPSRYGQQPSTPRQEASPTYQPLQILPKTPNSQHRNDPHMVESFKGSAQQLLMAPFLVLSNESSSNRSISKCESTISHDNFENNTSSCYPLRTINQHHNYNWASLYHAHHQSNSLREIHLAPNPAHIIIEPQGTTLELRGDQILAITLTPHPLLAQMDVHIKCTLNLQTGNVDYSEVFLPIVFFEPPSYFAHNPCTFLKPMNIISWNVGRQQIPNLEGFSKK